MSINSYKPAIFTLLTCLTLGSCSVDGLPSCGPDSEAVAYAKSLPQERLRRLFMDMEEYSAHSDLPIGGFAVYDKGGLPDEFADLKFGAIRPQDNTVVVEGCFDEYVYLDFLGIGSDQKKSIVLRYPSQQSSGGDISQALWIEDQGENPRIQ